jgi:hypothetical protein
VPELVYLDHGISPARRSLIYGGKQQAVAECPYMRHHTALLGTVILVILLSFVPICLQQWLQRQDGGHVGLCQRAVWSRPPFRLLLLQDTQNRHLVFLLWDYVLPLAEQRIP